MHEQENKALLQSLKISVKIYNKDEIDSERRKIPAPKRCSCGGSILPKFIEPVLFKKTIYDNRFPKGKMIVETIVVNTGIWYHPELCLNCKKSFEKEVELNERKQRAIWIMKKSGLSPVHFTMSCNGCQKYNNCPFDYCKDLKKNIFLWGETGRGKTGCGVCHIKKALTNGIKSRFESWTTTTLPKIKDARSKAFGSSKVENDVIRDLLRNDYIVIDELIKGKEFDPFLIEKLYFLFDEIEVRNKKGIIITSQISLEEIAKIDKSIANRILGNFVIKHFTGENLRG